MDRDDKLKDALLSELPSAEDLTQYRTRVNTMLADNQKAFERERRAIQVGWIVCVVISIGFLWFDGSSSTTPKGPWLACFTFLLGMMEMLKLFINRCRIDLLKEVKQVELQILAIRGAMKNEE
jgi:hypothetical protein